MELKWIFNYSMLISCGESRERRALSSWKDRLIDVIILWTLSGFHWLSFTIEAFTGLIFIAV